MSEADKFSAMSTRIEHNKEAKFGGAAVIVPPTGGGEPIELLMLDEQSPPAQFWATIKSRIEMILSDIEDKQRLAQGFGRR